MGRKKGGVNEVKTGRCEVCNELSEIKTYAERSICVNCRKINDRKYHREFMKRKYANNPAFREEVKERVKKWKVKHENNGSS